MKKLALGLAASAMLATVAWGDSHDTNPAVKARQSHMQLNAFNIGILGAMAQGKADYDADAASAAAANLAALTRLSQAAYWPPGTDNGAISGTRALPALWADMPGVMAKSGDLVQAAAAMEAAAGNGLEALQAAMGPLGGACGACHKAYRQPQ